MNLIQCLGIGVVDWEIPIPEITEMQTGPLLKQP